VSFTIVAFAVFMLVRSFNKMKREEEAAPPPAPPEPSAEEKLLGEIRDLLKSQA
jgi:large conductance mechanosensitive channel